MLRPAVLFGIVASMMVVSVDGWSAPLPAAVQGSAKSAPAAKASSALVSALDDPLKAGQFPPMFIVSPEALKAPEVLYKDMASEAQFEMRILGRYGCGIYDASASLCALMLAHPSDRRVLDVSIRFFKQLANAPRAYFEAGSPQHAFDYGSPRANQTIAKDGYFFNIYGPWDVNDPLTGTHGNWRQWQTKTGENAWLIKYLLYLHQYIGAYFPEERATAEQARNMAVQLGDAGICLQITEGEMAGAFRGGPRGQANSYFDEVSIENVESMESSVRYLYEVTGEARFGIAADLARNFLDTKAIVFQNNDKNLPMMLQQYTFKDGVWVAQGTDASDVIAWYLLSSFTKPGDYSGLERMEQRQGDGFIARLIENAVKNFGVFENERLTGMSFSQESAKKGIKSVEWGHFWEMALQLAAQYQGRKGAAEASVFLAHAQNIAKGLEPLRDANGCSPYSSTDDPSDMTSSKWGWNIMPRRFPSLIGTAWDILAVGYGETRKTPFQPLVEK